MGQYYRIANLDKKEHLDPHKFDEGAKLMEFGCSGRGMLTGLAVLLATSNGKGGGDLRTSSDLPGRWAGDRIAVVGDYSEGQYADVHHDMDGEEWTDISAEVLACICDDGYVAERHA